MSFSTVMWETKVFKTKKAMDNFIKRHGHKLQWHEVFVNNAYGIEFKKLRVVY